MKAQLLLLFGITTIILLAAGWNNYEEQLPSVSFYIQTVVSAILPSLAAIAAFVWSSRVQRRISLPFLIVAWFICGIGAIVYIYYALNGKADSLHSAAQMHVIAFPIVLGALTVVCLLIAGLISLLIFWIRRRSTK